MGRANNGPLWSITVNRGDNRTRYRQLTSACLDPSSFFQAGGAGSIPVARSTRFLLVSAAGGPSRPRRVVALLLYLIRHTS